MIGQVWEWCSSKYAAYPYQSDDEREELEGDDTRILRGGSWYDKAGYCRCGYRDWDIPWYRNGSRGFRCIRTLSS
jgi:formylglycine-generating enzyme required for sulfatase activity